MHREIFIIIAAMVLAAAVIFAAKPMASDCTTIRSGEIIGTDGNPVTTGTSDWGYNFQAHRFSGEYCLANEQELECPPGEPYLKMRWNDAFLSNMDCDNDTRLDTHYGYDSYVGSGAWLEMEIDGEDEVNGAPCVWDVDMMLHAIPVGAVLEGDVWMTSDGEEVGLYYSDYFALVELREENTCLGEYFDYKSKYKETGTTQDFPPKKMPKEHPVKAAKQK